eukprot:TRINITY_DN336_c0_g1_i2.p1 TRINITY_DN336_c0_g1~~TRINITY_DN336_c0_g1_i2.p1  ORF type:complete len:164 (-),score=42.86 TRINITY_DN336_c0_g1_i2:737-1228(-)
MQTTATKSYFAIRKDNLYNNLSLTGQQGTICLGEQNLVWYEGASQSGTISNGFTRRLTPTFTYPDSPCAAYITLEFLNLRSDGTHGSQSLKYIWHLSFNGSSFAGGSTVRDFSITNGIDFTDAQLSFNTTHSSPNIEFDVEYTNNLGFNVKSFCKWNMCIFPS